MKIGIDIDNVIADLDKTFLEEFEREDKNKTVNRTFVAQLTDTHCRYLATFRCSLVRLHHRLYSIIKRHGRD